MSRMLAVYAVLLSVTLVVSGPLAGAGGGKKGAKKEGDKAAGGKHPHIEKALDHLHEARENVLTAIRAEQRERKVDATVERELVKAIDDVNQAIAHARGALGLERREGKEKKKTRPSPKT